MSKTRKRVLTASHWGVYHVVVEDGTPVAVEPFEADPNPSPLMANMLDGIDAPNRIRRPAVREGWLRDPLGNDRSKRGAERFVEVSWDEAFELVAGHIDRIRTEHGPEALYAGSYGWSSAGRFHHAKSQCSRFFNAIGGATKSVDTYSVGAGTVMLQHVFGSEKPVWGPVSGWDVLAENTEVFLCFGGMPLKNAQINAGGVSEHRVRDYLSSARARGAEFILVSPFKGDLQDDVGAAWVPARPNTDTAFMLALSYVLETEGLADHAFLAERTVGYDRFKAYLLGETDGQPKTPDWAAAICDVPAETFSALARKLAAKRSFIHLSLSVQRSDHGEQTYWIGAVLAAMLGQVGLPGGGVGYGYAAVTATGQPVTPFKAPTFPLLSDPLGKYIPVARVAEMLERPGDVIDYNGERITFPDARMVYWAGGNPMHHHQDLNRFRRAMAKPEVVVVHESWWTPFARMADIVLPATTTWERTDIMASRSDTHVIAMKPVVDPVGEARDDYEIFAGVARVLGEAEWQRFTEGRTTQDWLRWMWEGARTGSADLGVDLPDFDAFWAQEVVRIPDREEPYEMHAAFRGGTDLPTPSGKLEIFSERIDGFGYDSCAGHPTWYEPAEWLGNAGEGELHLITNQPKNRLHSQVDMGRVSASGKVDGREVVHLSAPDAAARGLAEGDVVRIENARGACLAVVRLSETLRQGVALMATGAWYDPVDWGAEKALEKSGNPNVLTRDVGTSQLAQATSAQTTLVTIAKFEGVPPLVTSHVPPPIVGRDEDRAATA
ncbi:MAG: molybdopterin-dependent oxidoreductase [Pseudomonadota bacterium]|nr:molybdopterin-dependent oxidoreductase [Pseudomonadota bacterium]